MPFAVSRRPGLFPNQIIYEAVRARAIRWTELATLFPSRTGAGIKDRWYAVIQKREHKVPGDTDRMMAIREGLGNGEEVLEICAGDPEVFSEERDGQLLIARVKIIQQHGFAIRKLATLHNQAIWLTMCDRCCRIDPSSLQRGFF
jgi:hypothetical protein